METSLDERHIIDGEHLRLLRKTYFFSTAVAAALACLEIPWGTVLGVTTFVILSRASVRAMFDARLSDGEGQ